MILGQREPVTAPAKPVPVPDELSEPFWSAAARHELAMQRCLGCDHLAYPPTVVCRSCRADPPDFEWSTVSGRGRLKTWTVMRDAFLPAFLDEVPYVVGDIELDEQPGLRMVAQVIGLDLGDLRLGTPVEVSFEDLGDGLALPYFRPVAS